jgi:hypothetical protein
LTLLTRVYGIAPERLYATFFEGSDMLNIPRDDEAREIWRKYLPDDHILPGNAKDNFEEMGDTGPCGSRHGDPLRPDWRAQRGVACEQGRPERDRDLEQCVHAV